MKKEGKMVLHPKIVDMTNMTIHALRELAYTGDSNVAFIWFGESANARKLFPAHKVERWVTYGIAMGSLPQDDVLEIVFAINGQIETVIDEKMNPPGSFYMAFGYGSFADAKRDLLGLISLPPEFKTNTTVANV